MDLISDNFISYDDSLAVKQEKLSDHEVSLDSPPSASSLSTNISPISFPLNLRTFLHSQDTFSLEPPTFPSHQTWNKRPPFQISNLFGFFT